MYLLARILKKNSKPTLRASFRSSFRKLEQGSVRTLEHQIKKFSSIPKQKPKATINQTLIFTAFGLGGTALYQSHKNQELELKIDHLTKQINDITTSPKYNQEEAKLSAKFIINKYPFDKQTMPDTAIVLGSAQGPFAEDMIKKHPNDFLEINYNDIPGMTKTTVSGHKGRFLIFKNKILIVDGRKHYYETLNSAKSAYYVKIIKELGIKNLILTNASGSLDKDHCPKGTVGLITDFDGNIPHPQIGYPNFVSMTHILSDELNTIIKTLAKEQNIQVKEGPYYANQGPGYETKIQIDTLRSNNFKYVGMSSMPEAMVAAELGIKTACLTLATNNCIGTNDDKSLPPTHAEVKQAGKDDKDMIRLLCLISNQFSKKNK